MNARRRSGPSTSAAEHVEHVDLDAAAKASIAELWAQCVRAKVGRCTVPMRNERSGCASLYIHMYSQEFDKFQSHKSPTFAVNKYFRKLGSVSLRTVQNHRI